MAKHLRVKDVIKYLQKQDPEAKVVLYNTDLYDNGMYYATGFMRWMDIDKDDDVGEIEICSNYKSKADGTY